MRTLHKDIFVFPAGCNLYYIKRTKEPTHNGYLVINEFELIRTGYPYQVQQNKAGEIFGFFDEGIHRIYSDENTMVAIPKNHPHTPRELVYGEKLHFLCNKDD